MYVIYLAVQNDAQSLLLAVFRQLLVFSQSQLIEILLSSELINSYFFLGKNPR